MFTLEHNYTMMLKNPDGTWSIMYPKTVAAQVITRSGKTMEQHVKDVLHITAAERAAMDKGNTSLGFVVLDQDGYIPMENMNSSLMSIQTEFATIEEMLQGSFVFNGALVMVIDASGDENVNSGWAVYRRTHSENYWDLNEGWIKVTERESLDVKWDNLSDMPESDVQLIDEAVRMRHTHVNSEVLNNITGNNENVSYGSEKLAYVKDVTHFFAGDYVDDDKTQANDIWFKPSIGQSWWTDPLVDYAGTSCYELYRDQTMVSSPQLRTEDATTVCRMFYRCYNLVNVEQYDVRNCRDFTGMFQECTSIRHVPAMETIKGTKFDNMFYGCENLVYSPEMNMQVATSAVGMFSGCRTLERVLDFGSTSNVTDMRQMFNGCESLERIDAPIDFSSIESEEGVINMFNECINLEKIKIVKDSLKVSISFANTNLTIETILNILSNLPTVEIERIIDFTDVPDATALTEDDIDDAADKGWRVVI